MAAQLRCALLFANRVRVRVPNCLHESESKLRLIYCYGYGYRFFYLYRFLYRYVLLLPLCPTRTPTNTRPPPQAHKSALVALRSVWLAQGRQQQAS